MPAVRETDAVLPSFSDDKDVEHPAILYSSFNLANTTCMIHKSGENTGQRMPQEIQTKQMRKILNHYSP